MGGLSGLNDKLKAFAVGGVDYVIKSIQVLLKLSE